MSRDRLFLRDPLCYSASGIMRLGRQAGMVVAQGSATGSLTWTSKRDYRLAQAFPEAPDPLPFAGSGSVAVVVPTVSARLGEDEALSLTLLRRHLGAFDRYLLVPQGLELAFPHEDFRVIRVPAACMAGLPAYNRLMLSAWFYRIFAGYRQILLHQLDCLVFRNDLPDWCATGWSYLGAPWYRRGKAGRPKAVGNGGFSLRRTDHAIAVLESGRFRPVPRLVQQCRHFTTLKHLRILFGGLARAARADADRPLAQRFIEVFERPEDEFWAYYAPFFDRDFRLPPAQDALSFAVEGSPRIAFERLGRRVPFGCHAWSRTDRAFWLERLAETGDAATTA